LINLPIAKLMHDTAYLAITYRKSVHNYLGAREGSRGDVSSTRGLGPTMTANLVFSLVIKFFPVCGQRSEGGLGRSPHLPPKNAGSGMQYFKFLYSGHPGVLSNLQGKHTVYSCCQTLQYI